MRALTSEEQRRLFLATAARAAALVTRASSRSVAELVGDLAELPVIGAFVSFKKGDELRACMGSLAETMPLGRAVDGAVEHAVRDDPRFAPITSGELAHLTMEVWLLWGMEEVTVAAKERASVLEIGRHGIQIVRGGNRGLLLPGVATEHHLDAVAFLEAVCRKAGLPREAWMSPESMLFVFEGRCVGGAFPTAELETNVARNLAIAQRIQYTPHSDHLPTREETLELRNVCSRAFDLLVLGRTPSLLYPELWNGTVSGAAVALALPDRPLMVCSQLAVRPEHSLQSTLMGLVQVMHSQVTRLGATMQEIEDSTIDIAIYTDPLIHGTTAQYDISGLDPAARAVMVSGELGWVVLHRPTETAAELVHEAMAYVMAAPPRHGDVLSLAVVSTRDSLRVTSVSRPNIGSEERPAAVAGSFYPASAGEIAAKLVAMTRDAKTWNDNKTTPRPAVAVMLPHAGWVYSGSLTVATLARVVVPPKVIVFAPKHRGGGADWAIAPHRLWQLPGGSVASDTELAIRLDHGVDLFHLDAEPHRQEHAIEVLLPILRAARPDVQVVGLTLASAAWHTIQDAATQLAAMLATMLAEGETMPLLVISSDMHHFASEEQTLRVDQLALDAIGSGDPQHIMRVVHENKISMCGVTPCVLVIETLRQLGRLVLPEIVGHTTSGAVSGDRSRVVGYAGIVWK